VSLSAASQSAASQSAERNTADRSLAEHSAKDMRRALLALRQDLIRMLDEIAVAQSRDRNSQ
jgi:hypothetical protein